MLHPVSPALRPSFTCPLLPSVHPAPCQVRVFIGGPPLSCRQPVLTDRRSVMPGSAQFLTPLICTAGQPPPCCLNAHVNCLVSHSAFLMALLLSPEIWIETSKSSPIVFLNSFLVLLSLPTKSLSICPFHYWKGRASFSQRISFLYVQGVIARSSWALSWSVSLFSLGSPWM